jgi:hypothetical protein
MSTGGSGVKDNDNDTACPQTRHVSRDAYPGFGIDVGTLGVQELCNFEMAIHAREHERRELRLHHTRTSRIGARFESHKRHGNAAAQHGCPSTHATHGRAYS